MVTNLNDRIGSVAEVHGGLGFKESFSKWYSIDRRVSDQITIINMDNNLYIASMMLCPEPKVHKGRVILSCSDAAWEPIQTISEDIRQWVTDDLGNKNVEYGGFLFPNDNHLFLHLKDKQLFACFRGVHYQHLERIGTSFSVNPNELGIPLRLMGWDIANGNGWVSASCHGIFPINPYDGSSIDENSSLINEFGLFQNLADCLTYCDLNNKNIPEHSPWYPVAVFVDDDSYIRLSADLQSI